MGRECVCVSERTVSDQNTHIQPHTTKCSTKYVYSYISNNVPSRSTDITSASYGPVPDEDEGGRREKREGRRGREKMRRRWEVQGVYCCSNTTGFTGWG